MSPRAADVLVILGLVLLFWGLAWVSRPLALIVGGLLLLAVGARAYAQR